VARGDFQKALGVRLDPKVFNAGPEAMEALLAGEIDIAYVGPSPAINTYLKSGGRALRLLAGASSGGASLIAREDVALNDMRDLSGKRIAIPQLGGTQDVSLRHFIDREGLSSRERGGTVQIIPVRNPDILALLKRRQVDGAWVPEPWASRLVHEVRARRVVDERELWPDGRFATTVLVVRTAYLQSHPGVVQAVLREHLNSIAWLQEHPEEAREIVNAELERLTGKALPDAVLQAAWSHVDFTSDPLQESIEQFALAAATSGYLPTQELELAGLFDLRHLESARRRLAALPHQERP
jgi:NitT/TauT family transport system substrate-binding protein